MEWFVPAANTSCDASVAHRARVSESGPIGADVAFQRTSGAPPVSLLVDGFCEQSIKIAKPNKVTAAVKTRRLLRIFLPRSDLPLQGRIRLRSSCSNSNDFCNLILN